jgi:Mg-chelatase subunit ChlD
MGGILAVSLLLAQGARDRLAEGIRESNLPEVDAALSDVIRLDGKAAARALIAALPRARDRMDALLRATVGARQAYDNIDTSFAFNLEEEKIKQKALAQARLRIQEACKLAIEGEKVYDAARAAVGKLPPEAAPVLAAEAARTLSWILKCELYEGLAALRAEGLLRPRILPEREHPAVLATVLAGVASEKAAEFLEHPQWQVRLGALRGSRGSRDAVAPILDALDVPDLRFRNAAFEALGALTGTQLPPDPAVWHDWWKANAGEFVAGTYTPAARKELPGPRRTTFYDIPVASSRVCFVIDRSPSMRSDGRFDAAKVELRRLLDELPDGARINIVFFGGTTSLFARTTRALDRQARRDAADFIERQLFESGTDLYGALEKALSLVGSPESGVLREDGPDTIVVLSDGQATVGRLVDDELVARVIARRGRFLRPVIHTVSLSLEAKSLKMLSDLTGGEYRTK